MIPGRTAVHRMLAVAAALATVAGLVGLARPGPARAAAPVWTLAWSTDFNGSALPNKCYSYGGPYAGGDSYWDPSQIAVSGGMLRLHLRRGDMGGKHYLAGGVSCPVVSQLYGRFEWSAKVPVGKGVDSYATLWPVAGDGEADRTLVEIIGVPGAEVMAVTNAYGTGYDDRHVDGVYTDRFHTYAIEWTPALFRLTVDGTTMFSSTRISTVRKSLQFAMLNGDAFSALPNAATPLPAEFQIDWARAYTYGGEGAPAPTATAGPPTSAPAAAPLAAPGGTPSVAPATGPAARAAADTRPATAWAPWAVGALLALFALAGARLLWRRSTVDGPGGRHGRGAR